MAFFMPGFVSAASYEFGCADIISTGGTTSCTADVFTIGSGSANIQFADNLFSTINGQTYYISYSSVKTSGGNFQVRSTAAGLVQEVVFTNSSVTGDYFNQPYTATVSADSFNIRAVALSGFIGTISGFCITDTSGGCEVVPPAPTPEIYPVTSAVSTMSGAFSDTGVLLFLILSVLVAGIIALFSIAFALRAIKKWITGQNI